MSKGKKRAVSSTDWKWILDYSQAGGRSEVGDGRVYDVGLSLGVSGLGEVSLWKTIYEYEYNIWRKEGNGTQAIKRVT